MPADIVISAADGHATLLGMLDGKYMTERARQWHEAARVYPSYIQISLGINRDMAGLPRLTCFRPHSPVIAANREVPYLIVHNYSFDTTLAPKGKTPLVVRFFTDYGYWQQLSADRKAYRAEKDTLAREVIARLDALLPGITGQVEVVDVATPVTYTRYTETWRGATMSWLPTKENFSKSLEKTIPGLQNFYMAGQWLVPGGGLPNALRTGRDAVQIICKQDGRKFTVTVPE